MKKIVILFITIFLIVFLGMSAANVIGCVIWGLPNGDVVARIAELPFVAYALVSLSISAVILFLLLR